MSRSKYMELPKRAASSGHPGCWPIFALVALLCCLPLRSAQAAGAGSSPTNSVRVFHGRGVIQALSPEQHALTLQHEAIDGFMQAMTMTFKLKPGEDLEGFRRGDQVSFELHVGDDESWLDHVTGTGPAVALGPAPAASSLPITPGPGRTHPLLSFGFTNELGECVRLADFHGQALAITFFFTRCPIPEYCPRLSKNFAEASQKLAALPGAPTNWHFLSVSFDAEFDTPSVLKNYGERYHYQPQHWSFITGPAEKIHELASLSDATYEGGNGVFNHNFRTLIIDASGKLQTVFPTGGDLSDAIVAEMLKAAVIPPPGA